MDADPPATMVAVCISTLRRAEGLERTLASVARQRDSLDGRDRLLAVVVSNDPDDPGPAEVVRRVSGRTGLRIELATEPERGVAPPRNRSLEIARSLVGERGLIAFIDDDEVAEDGWLAELLRVMRSHGAGIVTGPVLPVFDHRPPGWIVRGGFFAPTVLPTGAPRRWAFTNNVLFEASLLDRWNLRFDPRFRRAGEDRHFFQRMAARGTRIVWAADARVQESIPASRACAPWLVRRQRSVGRCVAPIEREIHGAAHAAANCTIRGIVWLLLGSARAAIGCLSTRQRVRGMMWTAWGFGLIEGAWRPSVAGSPVSRTD
ncbi:MAG: glycosyltransferase family 2 protein [Proteobacteria bacterium]|nr:glycosyltransferase family 2 protein [Pseudomonadota bacterium]